MIDIIYNAYFSVVSYHFFEGVMALIIIFEFLYNFFERWDMI